MFLESINSPADVKKLAIDQLPALCDEVRQALLGKVSNHGGHVGPNLGMVEATVAMHYVFDSPNDKLVFDVSHQSYAHKILTGRREAFTEASHYDDVTGYSEPSESAHDHFVIGHTSTSVSLASGLAKARDLRGEHFNVIAVIGDGSLSGGEAFEGLDVAAELDSNMIVLVNDNQMSIAENHGGLYRNLQLLRDTNGEAPCNFFKAMGFDYIYVAEGNNVVALVEAFRRVKDSTHPVVLHINTLKGKGYRFAEEQKERFHWSMPFDIPTGELKKQPSGAEDYGSLTAEHLLAMMKSDPTVVAITAGTPTVFGFTKDRRDLAGRQFLDMGIAEEQAVAMASALAKGGAKPVFGVYSTFIQRAYDQMSQDLCINNNAATILVFWGSLGAMNDVTHLCLFDIPLISNIPNMVYLAPTCREEYLAMLSWSVNQNEHPVAIRVPAAGVKERGIDVPADYGKVMNRFEVAHRGSRVALIGVGNFFALAEATAAKLKEAGIDASVVNPRFLTGLDEEWLEEIRADHSLVVTMEDGVLDGGYGEKVARYYGPSAMRVKNYGVRKEFIDHYNIKEEFLRNRLTADQIAADVVDMLK